MILSPLADFLIARALNNPSLSYHLYWYLSVECQDTDKGPVFANVLGEFKKRLAQHDPERRHLQRQQAHLVDWLASMASALQTSKEPRPKKIERLRERIQSPEDGMRHFAPLPLPLDPSISVDGIVPHKSSVFKSNLLPMLITFSIAPTSASRPGEEYAAIYKSGDDLRQDQLVIQLITLMDMLLKRENLDLKLTPYRVLATGTQHGLVQFIPSYPLADVLATHEQGLLGFLRKHHGDVDAPYGVAPVAMDTYIKSCAGYCVITYVLGVGDRHLDNLLITRNGNLFHIDFGYILGRDPKPFPPPMKISREMIDAMGGLGSQHYARFCTLCFVAFSALRRHANLILNLLLLMVESGIQDIALEPETAVQRVQDKFRLDLTEEAALQYFQGLINDSASALFPAVIETIHKWAQYWRK